MTGPTPPPASCPREHTYTVQCKSGILPYLGPSRAEALAAVHDPDLIRDTYVWLSAEHAGSDWCKDESRAASLAAGLPDDYAAEPEERDDDQS